MKYGKLLKTIQNEDLHYIDYNYLKKQIYNKNFINILNNNIEFFDRNYKLQKIFNKNIYNYLILNYLSIQKIIKKYNKKNYKNIIIYLDKYKFYNDIINPKYIDDKICNICYENGFILKTDCNHELCFNCLLKCSNLNISCPMCRNNTILDPVLIYINNIIDNKDNKYSPFKKENLSIDLISDLHIDQWSNDIKMKHPYGDIVHKPVELNNKSDILIIAGDISDDIDLSIEYIDNISKKYEKILFVDGNHEHVNRYPNLYNIKDIHDKIKSLNNDKIVYLPDNEYIINDKVFIGYCGWWDYNDKKDINSAKKYFNKWIPEFTEGDNIKFIESVLNRAEYEYNKIKELIKKYDKDNSINKIILVTHSVGHRSFKVVDKSTDYNTMFKNIKSNKLSHWLFGHTHYDIYNKIDDVEYICNPRGRPDDFNRLEYDLKTLIIH